MALGVDSASNRNEFQESFEGGRRLKTENFTPSVSRLSRKFGRLDVSQPYGSPRLITGIASPSIKPRLLPFNGLLNSRFRCRLTETALRCLPDYANVTHFMQSTQVECSTQYVAETLKASRVLGFFVILEPCEEKTSQMLQSGFTIS
jgi:hypothetical protein